jgi:PTS system beta-glucosides-specific IIC component
VYEAYALLSPLKGETFPISQVNDKSFSEGMMGQGVAVHPEEGIIYAPADGIVSAVFPSGHAIGMQTKEGMEILIHIGLGTVELNGRGFKPKVRQGTLVRKGDLLEEFDIPLIASAGYDTAVMVLVANAQRYGKMSEPQFRHVKPLELIATFEI